MNYNEYKTLNKNRIYGTSLYSMRGRNKRRRKKKRKFLSIERDYIRKKKKNHCFAIPV